MSKIALSSNPSGTGTLTIAAPNTNTDRTLTLPDASGAVIVGTQPAGDIVGTTATQTLTNKTLTSPTMTTPTIDSAQLPTISGTAPLYMCRAWVNFDGTTTTPSTIRASGNVSSVTRSTNGDYTVNFATALPDANYSAVAMADRNATELRITSGMETKTTSSYRFSTRTSGFVFADSPNVMLTVFR